MAGLYFEPITDMTDLKPRDYPVSDITILDPFTANPLIEGEWLRIKNPSAQTLQWERPAGGAGIETNPLCGPWWGEKGRYDTRASGMVPCILFSEFEAYTKVCDTTGLTTTGQLLSVTDVTIDTIANRRGLKLARTGHVGDLYVAFYVSPGRKTGEIRILRKAPGFTVV